MDICRFLVFLHLSEEITFHEAPPQQNVTVDHDALVTCVVDGEPEPKVSWRYAGARINFSEFYLSTTSLQECLLWQKMQMMVI